MSPRLAAMALAAVLAAGCVIGPRGSASRPPFAPTVESWDWNATGREPSLTQSFGAGTMLANVGRGELFDVTPTTYDIDGDGVDEVIAQGNDTHVHVFRLDSGRDVADLPTTIPSHWYVERVLNVVAAGVLAPGEPPSLVVANHAAYVAAWRFDRAASTTDHFAFQRTWEHRMDGCYPTPSMDAGVALADDGAGRKTILVQTEETGIYGLAPDGTTLWHQCIGGGNAAPAVDDLDGDGRQEAIFGSDEGILTVVDAASGQPRWAVNVATAYKTWPGSMSVTPTTAELDGQPPREVLFTARHAWSADAAVLPQEHMGIFAVHGDDKGAATVLWHLEPSWANPTSYTRLVATDSDSDGRMDIFGMDWNTIGHYPGDWERLNRSHIFRLDTAGNQVWVRTIEAWWSNKDIAVGDFDGDGRAEVLANAPRLGSDGFWRLDAATGTTEGTLSFGDWKVLRGPAFADLRHDGHATMLVALESLATPGRGALVDVDLGGGVAA
ncbi:MAG: VCBS repeat-containing protein [bacterium]